MFASAKTWSTDCLFDITSVRKTQISFTEKFSNVKQSAWKSVPLGVTVRGTEHGEERAKSVKEDSCAFLLTALGVLTVGVEETIWFAI